MKSAIILGGNSDIGKELASRFEKDGWAVSSYKRNGLVPENKWDIVVVCIGVLNPIGKFFETDADEWGHNVDSNVLLPLRLLRYVWGNRNPGASVCFFSGAGTSRSAQTYSAYSSSKIMLFKMTELLDDEEDAKFFILGPGMVRTKIQNQSLAAGRRADNYERVLKFMREGDDFHGSGTSHDRIYECLRWCMSQPKEIIGGRNIYVPDEFGPELAAKLKSHPRFYKLRRHEPATVFDCEVVNENEKPIRLAASFDTGDLLESIRNMPAGRIPLGEVSYTENGRLVVDPGSLQLASDFGDPEPLFNSRAWLQKALESKGAKIVGVGCGMGKADIDIMLEGYKFNVSIKPLDLK